MKKENIILKPTSTILFILLLVSHISFTQESSMTPISQIGIAFSSFGESDLIRFQPLDGSASYKGDRFYGIEVNYQKSINRFLWIETGIGYSNYTIHTIPNCPPNADCFSSRNKLSIINVPLGLKANFLKYLFVTSGLLVDIDVSKNNTFDSQNGVGALLGFGVNYDFDFGASLFINPYIKAHSLLTFSKSNYPQRLMETGIRIGMAFKL